MQNPTSNLTISRFLGFELFRPVAVILFGIALLFAATMPIHAAVKIWDGSSSGNWSAGANWSGGVAPANGDDLVFPSGVTRTTITNDQSGLLLRSIGFNTGTNYIIHGNSVTVSNNVSAAHPSGHINTIVLAITSAKSQIFSCDTVGASLVLNGNISLGATTISDTSIGTLTFGGVVSGTGSITKTGTGTTRMQGSSANTYSGTTTVNAGTLELYKANAIAGPFVIGDGTGVDVVRAFASQTIATGVSVTINSSGLLDINGTTDTIGALTITEGDVTTGTGTLILGGDLTSGAFIGSGNGSISGNLSLGSATRTFNIGNSTLSSIELIVSANISGAGGLTKIGTGALLLSGSNVYSGITTVSNGTLLVAHGKALGSSSGSSGTVLAGGSLELEGVTVDNEWLTNNSSSSSLVGLGGAGVFSWWTSNIVLNANLTVAVLTNGYLFLSGTTSGSGALTKTQPGILSFYGSAPNTYTNTTTVLEGALELNKSAGDKTILGPLIIGDGVGGVNADVVRVFFAGQMASNVPVTITSSGLLDVFVAEDFGALSGSGNVIADGVVIVPGLDNSSSIFDGVISGDSLLKRGAGTLTLNGNNTYTNGTRIENGAILFNGSQPQNPVFLYGGTVGGNGTIGDLTSISGGGVSPGSSPGKLTCSNLFFTVAHAVTFSVQLHGTTPGSGYDQLAVRGTVRLGDSASLAATLGFASAVSNSFIIIDNDGTDPVTNNFVGLPEGATLQISGIPFRISYAGGTGNDVVLTQLLPLPSLSALLTTTTNIVFSWPTNYSGFTLESNTNLSTSVWTLVSPPPVISGASYVVTNIFDSPQKFFRLRAP